MSGWKQWTIGEVVEAADFQSFVQDQTVQNYADSAARATALGTAVAEGMVSYLQDTNQLEVYDGSDWVATTGDITAVTAGTALTGGGTAGSVTLNVDEAALFTGGTSGYTALSAGTAGLSFQPVSHNYIINGGFDIWQRGTSAATSGIATADRFAAIVDKAVTQSQQTFTPDELNVIGFGDAQFYYRTASSAGGSYQIVDQPIEDVRTLAGQTVTLSFWAKADSSVTTQPAFQQAFGSGGSTSVNVFGTDLTITTSWQRFTQTFSIPSVSGKTIGTGSNLKVRPIRVLDSLAHTIDLWGVQLEAGSVATPFKRHAPSLQGELAACQRYYQRMSGETTALYKFVGSGFAASSTQSKFIVPLKTTMRSQPSFSVTNATNLQVLATAGQPITTMTLDQSSPETMGLFGNVASGLTSGHGIIVAGNNSSDWFLEFSAEL